VHERSVDTDFLMLLLKEALARSPNSLKIVLMSATMDADKIANYFGGCPIVAIPGKSRASIEGGGGSLLRSRER
jgi:ATP-dependent RNA helicase DHX29